MNLLLKNEDAKLPPIKWCGSIYRKSVNLSDMCLNKGLMFFSARSQKVWRLNRDNCDWKKMKWSCSCAFTMIMQRMHMWPFIFFLLETIKEILSLSLRALSIGSSQPHKISCYHSLLIFFFSLCMRWHEVWTERSAKTDKLLSTRQNGMEKMICIPSTLFPYWFSIKGKILSLLSLVNIFTQPKIPLNQFIAMNSKNLLLFACAMRVAHVVYHPFKHSPSTWNRTVNVCRKEGNTNCHHIFVQLNGIVAIMTEFMINTRSVLCQP